MASSSAAVASTATSSASPPAERHARRARRGPESPSTSRSTRWRALPKAPSPMTQPAPLPRPANDRLESELADKKPLYSKAEARDEAERCLGCTTHRASRPARPESTSRPFIEEFRTVTTRKRPHNLRAEPPRPTPARESARSRSCATGVRLHGGRGADRDRAPPALRNGDRDRNRPVLNGAPRSRRREGRAASARAGVPRVRRLPRARGARARSSSRRTRFAGGLNTTGIAPVQAPRRGRPPRGRVRAGLGVEFRTGVEVGVGTGPATSPRRTASRRYDAVFLGAGLGADTASASPASRARVSSARRPGSSA